MPINSPEASIVKMGWRSYVLIFMAGLITAVGTGIGTIPLFWINNISDRLDVCRWGLAGGLMASASVFGFGYEMYRHPGDTGIGLAGIVGGVLLVVTAHGVIERLDFGFDARDIAEGDLRTVLPVFLVLLVHSFPEGLAVGVAFAHLHSSTTLHLLGFTVPLLAVVTTVTIGVHNIPEGVAIAVPVANRDNVGNARMFGAAVFSSLPQPVGGSYRVRVSPTRPAVSGIRLWCRRRCDALPRRSRHHS